MHDSRRGRKIAGIKENKKKNQFQMTNLTKSEMPYRSRLFLFI